MAELSPKATAEKLVANMHVFYDKYDQAARKLAVDNIRSGAWINRWFTGSNKVDQSEIHKQFYDAVEKRCALLDGCLGQLPPEEARPIAAEAVSIVLDPVPDSMRDAGGWVRLAAEPLCEPLLKYLSREELEAIRAKYLDVYPKRMMFASQKKLLKAMDGMLK